MDNKLICPACKKEIVDIVEFKKSMTCPSCKAFLKNNKEIAKSLSAQGAKKNSAVNSKSFMGINIPAQSGASSAEKKPEQQPQNKQAPNPKSTEEKATVKKEFNQSSRLAPKVQTPVSKEDLSLFNDNSSDYIPPELDALYDDDDYITVENEAPVNEVSAEDENDYFEPDDDEDDVDIWGNSIDDDNDVPVTAVLADLDDEDEFSDADILGTPNVDIPDEDYLTDEDNEEEDILEQEDAVADDTVNDDNTESELPLEETVNEEPVIDNIEVDENKQENSDLDLFSDLNAVASAPVKKTRPQPATVKMEEPIVNNVLDDEEEYFEPEDDENEEYYDSSEDYNKEYEDDMLPDDVDDIPEEPQMSIAAKFVKNLKKPKKRTALPDDNETTIDINDDIGRKVEKNFYNSNKDGYYSDAQPFIDPEPDIIPSGSLLKVVGIFAALIFFTAYFIYML